MTPTVTLLANHKGITTPRVMGDEYVVDAVVDITSYTANGEALTASQFGLSSINAVMVTGISVDTITGGYEARMIAPEVESGSASGGKYSSTSIADFQIHAKEASSTDNIGEIRLRIWGQI